MINLLRFKREQLKQTFATMESSVLVKYLYGIEYQQQEVILLSINNILAENYCNFLYIAIKEKQNKDKG
ncbi:hypothetical protein LQZ19_02895 [Treponema primitia]|uniref:hypothetical protein n=1 Tax=Treponema primitia TaxID=88058 RepID=UPI00397FEACF